MIEDDFAEIPKRTYVVKIDFDCDCGRCRAAIIIDATDEDVAAEAQRARDYGFPVVGPHLEVGLVPVRRLSYTPVPSVPQSDSYGNQVLRAYAADEITYDEMRDALVSY